MPTSREPTTQLPWLLIAAETALGLVLAATPLALWVAWSPAMLFAVLAAALVSALLLVLFHRLEPPARDASAGPPARLEDSFFVEMHRIFPLVYHHSRGQSARFRAAMRRVRRLLA